jgi:hypothetical protein
MLNNGRQSSVKTLAGDKAVSVPLDHPLIEGARMVGANFGD